MYNICSLICLGKTKPETSQQGDKNKAGSDGSFCKDRQKWKIIFVKKGWVGMVKIYEIMEKVTKGNAFFTKSWNARTRDTPLKLET